MKRTIFGVILDIKTEQEEKQMYEIIGRLFVTPRFTPEKADMLLELLMKNIIKADVVWQLTDYDIVDNARYLRRRGGQLIKMKKASWERYFQNSLNDDDIRYLQSEYGVTLLQKGWVDIIEDMQQIDNSVVSEFFDTVSQLEDPEDFYSLKVFRFYLRFFPTPQWHHPDYAEFSDEFWEILLILILALPNVEYDIIEGFEEPEIVINYSMFKNVNIMSLSTGNISALMIELATDLFTNLFVRIPQLNLNHAYENEILADSIRPITKEEFQHLTGNTKEEYVNELYGRLEMADRKLYKYIIMQNQKS